MNLVERINKDKRLKLLLFLILLVTVVLFMKIFYEYYVYSKHLENEFIRIDVIEVYFNNGKYMVNHIKQVI